MSSIHVHAPLNIAAGAVLPLVCFAAVVLRFYGRRRQNYFIGWDDWLTIPVLGLLIAICAILLVGVSHGAVGYPGLPASDPHKIHQQQEVKLTLYLIETIQPLALMFLKLSIVLFYRRLFNVGSGKWFNITTWIIMALVIIWGVSFFFTWVFYCAGHRSAYWESLKAEEMYCVNTTYAHWTFAPTDAILDYIIFLVPVPPVVRLQMSLKRKMAVLSVFGVGSLALVASTIRMVTYIESVTNQFSGNFDLVMLVTGGCYWGTVELGVGLLTACMPTVYSAFRQQVVQSLKQISSNGGSQALRDRFSTHNHHTSGYQRRQDSDDQTSGSQMELAPMGTRAVAKGHDLEQDLQPEPDRIFVTKTMETTTASVV